MYAYDGISSRLLLNNLFTHIGPTTRQPRTSTSAQVQCYIWSWHFVADDDRWDTTIEVELIGCSLLGAVCSSIVFSYQP